MKIAVPTVAGVIKGSGLTERAACRRLSTLAGQVDVRHAIVEMGSYRGRTAGWLALGAAQGNGAHITCIDPWDTIVDTPDEDYVKVEKAYGDGRYASAYAEFSAHATRAGLWGRITPLEAQAGDVAAVWKQPVGLLYHDALHTLEAVEADLRAWAPFVVSGGWVACHDLGNVHFGVEEGASRVLDNDDWDWAGRERLLWKKAPHRRGLLVVRRR